MKTKATIAAAGLILAGAVLVSMNLAGTSPEAPSPAPTVKHHKSSRIAKHTAIPATDENPAEREPRPDDANDEAVNLSNWQKRFDALLAENGDREAAVAALMTEIDSVFGVWVNDQITPLAKLPPAERYDRLTFIETAVHEGAAAILEQLGVEGSLQVSVAAGALESVSAEIQYAESAPDHASRLAMLRLDNEREARMEKALSIADETAKTAAMSELDTWYDSSLAGVFPSGEVN